MKLYFSKTMTINHNMNILITIKNEFPTVKHGTCVPLWEMLRYFEPLTFYIMRFSQIMLCKRS